MKHRHISPAAVMIVVILLLITTSVTLVSAATVPVTPANVLQITQPLSAGQVAVYVTRGNTSLNPENSTARYTFVSGPGTPPMGGGSLHMPTGSGTGAGNGGRVWVANSDLDGTLLSAIPTLSYSSYVVSNGSGFTAPSLNLYVDLNNNGVWEFSTDALLVYEPYWNGTVSLNTWQSWNAATGRWWDARSKVASGAGGGVCNRTLAQIVAGTNPAGCSTVYAAQPNARVIAQAPGLPGLYTVTGDSIGSSGWVNFDGYLDALNTGVNLYDFEPPTTVYVDPAWTGTPVLTGSLVVAHRTPFGTAPFVTTCPQLTPKYFGLDGFASQADVTAALGAGFTGQVVDCSTVNVTPAPTPGTGAVNAATAPLCSLIGGGTNSIVRANVADGTVPQGSVFCQVITENSNHIRNAAEIGVPSLIERGPIQAVEVFGLLHDGQSAPDFAIPVTVCLAGSGQFVYLNALQAPREPAYLPSTASAGYTCATISDAGTVVLVP